MPQFWEAAAVLDLECISCVIATISDGTCPYRSFCQLYNPITNGYAIKPSFSLQNRDIFTFFQTLPFIKNHKETPM